MGREIVYCEACGTGLREADFAKGKACKLDNRPYCTACAPVQPAAPVVSRPGATPRSSNKKISSTSVPAQPGTPRRSMPPVAKRPSPMILAACVAGGIVILILIMVAASGRPKPPPPPPSAPKTSVDPAPAPPPERRVTEEPPPRKPVAVQREPETLKEPTEQEKSAKLDAFLAQIRTMISADKEFERREEIGGMIAAAEKSAGSRLADVRALREHYERSFEDAAKASGKPRSAEPDAWKLWKIESSNEGGCPKFHASHAGRENVLETHPLSREKPAGLEREFDLPAGKKSTLSLWVAPHSKGDWELRILADGKLLHKLDISPPNSGWKPVTVDLSPLAGKKTLLRLENAATGWLWEYGFWSGIEIRSE